VLDKRLSDAETALQLYKTFLSKDLEKRKRNRTQLIV
jgi:hypothetical protein